MISIRNLTKRYEGVTILEHVNLEIEKGDTLVFEVGGMILPRIGSATCFSPSNPGLINVTTGSELSADKALTTNNLYVVTVAGRGFTATGSTNKFLIAGSYTIK